MIESFTDSVRLDRWLWAARFFKSRAQAKKAIEAGNVELNGRRTKPAREMVPGAVLGIRRGPYRRVIVVKAVARQRRSAVFAATLYEETEESIRMREEAAAERRLQQAGFTGPSARPDRRSRRALKRLKQKDG